MTLDTVGGYILREMCMYASQTLVKCFNKYVMHSLVDFTFCDSLTVGHCTTLIVDAYRNEK